MDNELNTRKTPRAYWHEYAGGMYFVTVVTHNREHYFGKICDNKMCLSEIGLFLETQIKNISIHHRYAKLVNHVVMPNHLHAIIYIEENDLPHQLRTLETVNGEDHSMDKSRRSKGWLSVIVGSLKSAVSAYAHGIDPSFKWQRRYHDHIIKDEGEMCNIMNYIDNNVVNWGDDMFNEL